MPVQNRSLKARGEALSSAAEQVRVLQSRGGFPRFTGGRMTADNSCP